MFGHRLVYPIVVEFLFFLFAPKQKKRKEKKEEGWKKLHHM
jgi:hypothetical protein